MIEQAFVHVGLAKTATTTIQRTLAANRQKLGEHGALFPSFAPNHFNIAYAVSGPPARFKRSHVFDGVANAEQWAERGRKIDSDLRAEIEATKARKLILSAESFSCWPTRMLFELRDYLSGLASWTSVILYLRDPLDWQNSMVLQLLRGGTRLEDANLEPFPYAERIPKLQEVFGELDIRLLEKARAWERGIVGDFLQAIGVEAELAAQPPANVGSSLEQALIFDRINRHFPPMATDGSGPNPERDRFLVGWLQKVTSSTKFDVSSVALHRHASAYRRQYEWLNEHVPETQGLYCYPQTMPEAQTYDLEEAFSQACRIVSIVALERSRLAGEVERWKAKYAALARAPKEPTA